MKSKNEKNTQMFLILGIETIEKIKIAIPEIDPVYRIEFVVFSVPAKPAASRAVMSAVLALLAAVLSAFIRSQLG